MSVFTLEMKLLTAIVLEEYTEDVKKELLRLGLLDFIEVGTLSKKQYDKLQSSTEQKDERIYDVINQIESLYHQIKAPVPQLNQDDVGIKGEINLSSTLELLDDIRKELSKLREKQKNNNQELNRYQEMARYIKEKKLSYLDFHTGEMDKTQLETLTHRLSNNASLIIPLKKENTFLLATFSRDRTTIEEHLTAIKFTEDVAALSNKEILEITQKQLDILIKEKDKINTEYIEKINTKIKNHIKELESSYKKVRLYELLGKMSSHFSHTRNTTVFSGWVPSDKADLVEDTIKKASKKKSVISFDSEKVFDRKNIPVAIQNNPVLKPFQNIVSNYSTLEYGSVNPTVLVAISYLAMFGLMFADAGQGLVLLLLGLFGRYREKRGKKDWPIVSFSLLRLVTYLGLASIVTGVLWGSYFGYPLFPAIWFDFHDAVFSTAGAARDVYSILGVTIYFGIIIIFLGLLVNWVNLIKKKEFMSFVFGKNGILGAILFAVGIYVGREFVMSNYKEFPNSSWILYVLGFVIIALLFKVPLERLIAKKKDGASSESNIFIDSFMEWIVLLLEIFAGYLANTLSFMRVAGLGIAHAALMTAFFQMSDLTSSIIGKVLILVAGNALVISLEGLSAGIQSLRLNYYEFFTKFFVGDGKEYNPISLQSKSGD